MNGNRPIIIVKKQDHGGGHHGGAWKVAYADFVTAMMALFIVLWLLNASKQVQVAVGGYFKDPSGSAKKVGSNQAGSGENLLVSKDDMSKLKDDLQMSVRKVANFDKLKNMIEMTVTSEGLRIELMESEKGMFFDSGSPSLSDDGKDLLTALAQELGKLPNTVSIEGHTDSKPYGEKGNYSNWELSTDRANAARRIMQDNGFAAHQVTEVRGFADSRLRKPDAPEDASNRRISVLVHYTVKPEGSEPPAAAAAEAAHGTAESPQKH